MDAKVTVHNAHRRTGVVSGCFAPGDQEFVKLEHLSDGSLGRTEFGCLKLLRPSLYLASQKSFWGPKVRKTWASVKAELKSATLARTCLNIGNGVNGGKGVGHAAENLKALFGLKIGKRIVWKNDTVDKLHDKKRRADDARRRTRGKYAGDGGQVALQGAHYSGLAQNAVS